MTTDEIRGKFLEFFKEKGHAIIPSGSLIPENDPTVLFTTVIIGGLTRYGLLALSVAPLVYRVLLSTQVTRTRTVLPGWRSPAGIETTLRTWVTATGRPPLGM